jgi:hypothetical protein
MAVWLAVSDAVGYTWMLAIATRMIRKFGNGLRLLVSTIKTPHPNTLACGCPALIQHIL